MNEIICVKCQANSKDLIKVIFNDVSCDFILEFEPNSTSLSSSHTIKNNIATCIETINTYDAFYFSEALRL